MKKLMLVFVLFLLSFCLYAQSLTGRQVMENAENVPEAKTSSCRASMTLINKKGKKRVREVIMKSKDYGDTEKSVIVFTSPKDVSGVSYLSFDYDMDGKDSDSWLYMPAMKKVRRISGSSKGDDFMGTDFTYEDIGGDRKLDDYTYNLLGEEESSGIMCYKVECTAKDKSKKNPRYIVWIGKENFMIYKADFYDKRGDKQRELTCSKVEKVDGFWTIKEMFMKNVQTEHSTSLELKDIKYGIEISDSIFTQSALEREAIK